MCLGAWEEGAEEEGGGRERDGDSAAITINGISTLPLESVV